MTKTRHCDECKHQEPLGAGVANPNNNGLQLICAKGHKPRFYAPRTTLDYHLGTWGSKRRCDNFSAQETGK